MAKLVRNFIGQIGGIASKVTGGDFYGDSESVDVKASSCGGGSAESKSQLEQSSKHSLSSEDDRESHGGLGEEGVLEIECPVKKGHLSKWTNYLHGWQERYVVVAEGVMSYFKTEYDTQYGCRGSISMQQVKILVGSSCPHLHVLLT